MYVLHNFLGQEHWGFFGPTLFNIASGVDDLFKQNVCQSDFCLHGHIGFFQ